MKKLLLIVAVCAAGTLQAQKKLNPSDYAKTITPDDLKKHLFIVAGKEMEGRETAMPGQKKAAAYIENQFKSLGLLPGNNGSYQLLYGVYQDSLISASLELNGKAFEADKDFSVNAGQNSSATYRFGEVVFVGNGQQDSLHDDYKGVDVRGKVVLMLAAAAPQPGQGRGGFRNMFSRVDAAQKNGAVAVLTIGTVYPRTAASRKGGLYTNGFQRIVRPNQFTITENVAKAIMGADWDSAKAGNFHAKAYAGELMLSVNKATTNLQSSDVMGVIEGTDLKDQYVFVTAHYDHLGKQRDTVIYYGADDDGSGTVSVLEMAEAFAKAKAEGKGPRRTMVFMTVSGEEKGLWGSEYYTSHPVFPLDKTTVDLNIDMIGRIDSSRHIGDSSNYVYVVGDDKVSTDLKPISEMVNKKYTKLELDYKFNDPKDPNRIYFRSDHYNFAAKGVPIIFYYDGMLKADYHRPTDTPDKINYTLLAKRAQLVFYTAWEMANRDEMLKRDLKLDVPQR